MAKENLLLWHIGLGDALICNGLVRELHERLGQVTLPILPKYRGSIEWMFGDLPGVKLFPLDGFDELTNDLGLRRRHIRAVLNLADYNEIAIGLLNVVDPLWKGRRTFDEGFYDQAGVPFEFKWSKFFHRKHPDQITPPAEPYAFVHMDPSRKFVFTPRVTPNLRVITNLDLQTDNFFRLQDVLEQASEIHVMESSFSNWIELMPSFRERPMFLYDAKHMYRGAGFPALRRRPWQIISWCPTRGLRLNVRGRGNAAALTVSDDTQHVTIATSQLATDVRWDIQLRKPDLPLVAGTIYELSFLARSPVARLIGYGVNDSGFNSISGYATSETGPDWQEYRRTFTALRSDEAADLHIDVGGAMGSVDLSHVTLRRLGDGVSVEPLAYHGCACWPPLPPEDYDA